MVAKNVTIDDKDKLTEDCRGATGEVRADEADDPASDETSAGVPQE